jgi:hypothetical protein
MPNISRIFNQFGSEMMKHEPCQMIRAWEEQYFLCAKSNAQTKLHHLSPFNMQLLKQKLERFADCNREYSKFQINKMKGSRGLHGSSMPEQNHASIMCNLNDGHTKNSTYCEQPIALYKNLMERNRVHTIRMNKTLGDTENVMLGVIEELEIVRPSESIVYLVGAAKKLSKPDYD